MTAYESVPRIIVCGILLFLVAIYQYIVAQQIYRMGTSYYTIPLISTINYYPGWISAGVYFTICGTFSWISAAIIMSTLSRASNGRVWNMDPCWHLSCFAMVLQFGAGVLSAVLFAVLNQDPYIYLDSNTLAGTLYWLYLAQTIASFAIGWPCALFLFMASSYWKVVAVAGLDAVGRGFEMSRNNNAVVITI